jgi:hypothetical protein
VGERASDRARPGLQSAPITGRELAEGALPGALAGGEHGGGAELVAQRRRGGELQQGAREVVRIRAAEQAGVAVLDQRRRPALGDGDDGQATGAGLEDRLTVGVGGTGEEEDIGAGVGAGQLLAAEPTEEGRVPAKAGTELTLLGAAPGQQQVEARIGIARPQEALGQQVDPLLAGHPAGVEDLDLAWGRRRGRP